MDYEEQSRKDKPFEGLSPEEAKRLFVYMCYVAHPRLTPEDVEKRWGKVLPPEEIPTVFEAMEIAEKMKQTDNHIQQDSQVIATPSPRGATAWKAAAWILVVLGVFAAIALGVSEERKAEMRKQEEMRIKKERRMQEELRRKEEARKQKQEELRRKEKTQREMTALMTAVSNRLSSANASPDDLLKLGLRLQSVRESVLQNAADVLNADTKVLLEELLLRCYKKARGNVPPSSLAYRSSVEACYRISLLYLPNRYRSYVDKNDRVYALSEFGEMYIAKRYLKEAAECNHYRALSLFCTICFEEIKEIKSKPSEYTWNYKGTLASLEQQLTTYGRLLADNPMASGNDVYFYAWLISNISPDESVRYLKKAARMGNTDAKKELLRKGITFDE